MYVVIKVHRSNGKIEAHGPFREMKNARSAAEWHSNPVWHSEVVPLTRVLEGTTP